jgi:hypothetical protein
LMLATGALALSACKTTGELVADDGVGITAVRSVCPAVGLADYTGDITLLRGGSTAASAIDITAAITDVRAACDSKANPVESKVTFRVLARRADARGDRDVILPFFVTVVRGTNVVIAKRLGQVKIHFADGQTRAQATGEGSAVIDRSEATLDRTAREKITRERKAGSADAAIDPLTDPDVKKAVARATFEVLVGFQLTPEQLQYNATR